MTDAQTSTTTGTAPQPGIGGQFSAAVLPLGRTLAPAGTWATLGGLAVYFVVSLAEPSFFYPLSSLTWAKLVVLLCGVAAAVDAFRPTTMVAAVANVGSVFVVGTGALSFLADSWGGPVGWNLALVIADGALAVGFVAFLGRAAAERAEASTTSMFETVVLVLGGAVLLIALVGNRDWFFERYVLRTAGIWLVVVAAVVTALLTRSRPGLITGGLGSLVVALALLSEFHRYNLGGARWVLVLGLLATTGIAGWQFTNLRSAPTSEPYATGAPSAASPSVSTGNVATAPSVGAPGDYASFGARLIAAIVDGLIFSISTVVLYALLIAAVAQESGSVLVLAFTAPIALDVWLLVWYCRRTARTGQSWGKSAAGIYLVKTTTGMPPSAWGVFGRGLASWLSTLPCYLGYFWMLWDPARQTWHDKIAGTIVVRSMVPRTPEEQATASITGAAFPAAAPPTSDPNAPAATDSAAAGPLTAALPSAVEPEGRVPSSTPADRPNSPGLVPTTAEVDDRTVPRPGRANGVTLTVSDGRTVLVESLLLVGRDPSPSSHERHCATLSIAGDLMVSKTHLAIGLGERGPVVHDRNSTNGVSVLRDGQVHPVARGSQLELIPGDRIDFGESWLRLEPG